jgi:hypothetical protein
MWIVLVAGSAVVLAACIFAYNWLRRVQNIRRYYFNEAARYALDEELSKEAWRHSLAYLDAMQVRTKETLDLVKKIELDNEAMGKSASAEDALLQAEIGNARSDTEKTRRTIINQTQHSIEFWREDMVYSSFMKQRYLDAASHPWWGAPAFLSKSSFLSTRKQGAKVK